jgi:hypothetical protein
VLARSFTGNGRQIKTVFYSVIMPGLAPNRFDAATVVTPAKVQ